MNYSLYDFIGNLGVLMIIGTYFLLQLGRLKSDNIWYSIANLVGASLVIVSLLVDFNQSAFIIELFWVLISMVGVYRYVKNRTRDAS